MYMQFRLFFLPLDGHFIEYPVLLRNAVGVGDDE